MTDDGLAPVIKVVFFAGPRYPGVIADESVLPYSVESFETIEKWTGMPSAHARQALDAGEEIGNALFTFRLAYTFSVEEVAPHTPCGCQVCAYVMANDLLPAGRWDCYDYPRSAGEGECSDPQAIGCSCLGTAGPDAPCEGCELASQSGHGWDASSHEASAEDESRLVIHVWFTEGTVSPEHVTGERTWPYTTASLKKIERITGITPARARTMLDSGSQICTSLIWLRLLPSDPEEAVALLASPSPQVLLATDGPGAVTLHAPCDCAVCSFVATRGYLEEGEMDCNDHPRNKGRGPCSDPHAIGCTCLGTVSEGGPCEACEAYLGAPESVAKIVAGRKHRGGGSA